MVKSEDNEGLNENRSVQSERDIKDLIWVVEQTRNDYWKLGKEEFETHPALPLRGFRWDDQLDIYRWEVMRGLSKLNIRYQTILSEQVEDLTYEIVDERVSYLDDIVKGMFGVSNAYLNEENTPENLDRFYIRCCQVRDAANPDIFGGNDEERSDLYHRANTLVHLLARIQTGFGCYWKREDLWDIGRQLIRNTPKSTTERQRRIKAAYLDLNKVIEDVQRNPRQ